MIFSTQAVDFMDLSAEGDVELMKMTVDGSVNSVNTLFFFLLQRRTYMSPCFRYVKTLLKYLGFEGFI